MHDLLDEQIVNSASLMSEIGVAPGDSMALLEAIAERRLADGEADTPDFDSPVVLDEDAKLCESSGANETELRKRTSSKTDDINSDGVSKLSEVTLSEKNLGAALGDDVERGGLSKTKQIKEKYHVRADDSPELKLVYAKASKQFPVWAYVIILSMTAFTVSK